MNIKMMMPETSGGVNTMALMSIEEMDINKWSMLSSDSHARNMTDVVWIADIISAGFPGLAFCNVLVICDLKRRCACKTTSAATDMLWNSTIYQLDMFFFI